VILKFKNVKIGHVKMSNYVNIWLGLIRKFSYGRI